VQEQLSDIRGIIFDLDGTLYVSPPYAATIQEAAVGYICGIKKIDYDDARQLLAATRRAIIAERDEIPTLSAVCRELGGDLRDLHSHFEACLRPEQYLAEDPRVVAMLEKLANSRQLYLFTNNSRALTTRIIDILGIGTLFGRIFTINETWKGKPDDSLLDRVLTETGLLPFQALFVGDRYDVDLRLPEQRGCPVYLSQSIEQLLRLGELLKG